MTRCLKYLTKILDLHEGRRLVPYKDTLGYWTVGVGHLMEDQQAAPTMGPITNEECDALLAADIEKHVKTLPEWVADLDDVRYVVLVDMAFNMGSLKGWPNFLRQVRERRFEDAADNMRSSLWARQVKSRAQRLSMMMESGAWPVELV